MRRVRKTSRRTKTTLALGAALAGVALIVWAAPSLHLGKASGQRVSGAAAFRYVPSLDRGWLLSRINARRRQAGRRPLALDRAASLLAQQQSSQMADAGRLLTISNRDLRPFSYAGAVSEHDFHYEGGSLPRTGADVFADMMGGKDQRARRESLQGRFNRVGIGITRRPPNLWVTLIFIRA